MTPCKTVKDYLYIPEILQKIVLKRLEDDVGMNLGLVLEADDPRRISSHLAPIPPPPTSQIVAEQRSRFTTDGSYNRSTEDPDQTIDYWNEDGQQ